MPSAFERLKASVERMVFAGLKPDAPEAPGPNTLIKKLGVAVGILMIAVCLYFLVTVLNKPVEQSEDTVAPPPPVEIVPKGFQVDTNKELEVVEMDFNKNKEPKEITGTLRNLTGRTFAKCEVSFSITTKAGDQLGGAVTTVKGLQPHGSARFRIPVPYANAGFAMVRELRTD